MPRAMIQSRQIEAFRAVMLIGTMTGAAEAMGVTQPAVSRLIRDLEAELGLPLFDRRGGLVVPTAAATALMVEVERSFVGLERIAAFAQRLRSGRGGSLRIAALPAMAAGFLPRFIAGYSRERPLVKILVAGLPSNGVRDGVIDGRFDLGLTAYHAQRRGFPYLRQALDVTPLGDGAVVAMPPGHRLAARSILHAEDLRDEPLILLSTQENEPHPIDVALRSVSRRTSIETQLATIACVLVSAGAGLAVVDRFSASEFGDRNLVVRPFEPSGIIGTAIVASRGRALSAIADDFRAAFLEHVRLFLARND